MTALALLQQLHDSGVLFTPLPDGTVRYRARQGVLTPALLDAIRQHKSELHVLVEDWSGRAAIAEYCGGLTREEAERLAWQCVLTPHAGCAACGYPGLTQHVGSKGRGQRSRRCPDAQRRHNGMKKRSKRVQIMSRSSTISGN